MRAISIAATLAAAFASMEATAQTTPSQPPEEWIAAAKTRAEAAPDALSRRSLGQVALPNYGTAKFRDVRAHYIPQELINDQVIFCGEIDAVVPSTKQRSGWTKFIYIPGDPTTLMTDTPGLGTREIGPQVRKHMCESGKERWLPGDFTPDFQRLPRSMAEAQKSQ